MKIETINELLIDVIGKASKISTKNPNQPILENVLLEVVDESTLRVTSYNLDIIESIVKVGTKKSFVSIVYIKYKASDYLTRLSCHADIF